VDTVDWPLQLCMNLAVAAAAAADNTFLAAAAAAAAENTFLAAAAVAAAAAENTFLAAAAAAGNALVVDVENACLAVRDRVSF